METLKALLVDDEPLALEVLASHIKKFPHMEVAESFNSAKDAEMYLNENSPDVIFLDIQMPEVNGLELMERIKDRGIPVIFVTAFPSYAVEAFDLEALDYMVKPVSLDRFKKSVERLEELIRYKRNKEEDNVKLEGGFIFVKSDSRYVKLSYDEILFVEAFADYVKIYISIFPDKRIITLQTMKKMEATLPKDKFVRVHRSYIVAIDKVTSLTGTDLMIGRKQIPIGKNYKDTFLEAMSKSKFLK